MSEQEKKLRNDIFLAAMKYTNWWDASEITDLAIKLHKQPLDLLKKVS
jgi:hypothetical protein